MLRKLFSFGAALLFTALAPVSAGAYSALYSFGDSLSDVGNFYTLSGFSFPASPPYFPGRFSNGPNFVDSLSAKLGLGPVLPSLLPLATPVPPGGNDWAWGDATTGNPATNNSFPPNGAQQVQAFLGTHSGVAPSGGLYTFTLGSNDLFNILGGAAPTEVTNAAKVEADAINMLAGAGAKSFIVVLVPDLGKTPFAQDLGVQSAATALALEYNKALKADLAGVAGVRFLDTFAWLDSAVANPAKFGLTNATKACYSGVLTGLPGGTLCDSPDTYLFWDDVHPTAAVDEMLAAIAAPSPTPGAGFYSLGALILLSLIRKAPAFLARLKGI